MKCLIALCLFAFAAAQHHGDHHPHPGGPHHCNDPTDCQPCDGDRDELCIHHECRCSAPTGTVVKRAGETCQTVDDCPDCTHGNKVCEKHNDHGGHCHCKH